MKNQYEKNDTLTQNESVMQVLKASIANRKRTFNGVNPTSWQVKGTPNEMKTFSNHRKKASKRREMASNELQQASNGLNTASTEAKLTASQVKAPFVFPQRGKAGASGASDLLGYETELLSISVIYDIQ